MTTTATKIAEMPNGDLLGLIALLSENLKVAGRHSTYYTHHHPTYRRARREARARGIA